MLSFWSWSNPSEFHKTSAGRICLVEEDQCRNTNIFGRHAINDPNVERNFASKGDIDFSVTKFKFCDKCEKVATNTMKEIEFLGLVINSVNMALALPQEKNNKCMQLIASPKAIIMELNKLLGKLSFTAQAVLPWRISCRYLLQQKLQAMRETNSYQTEIKLSQHSLAELEWWKENLLLQNSKPLKIGIPQLIIRVSASKTGLGAAYIRKGQNVSVYWSSLQ